MYPDSSLRSFEALNGWTDAPNAIATVVSTRVMPPMTAVAMAGALNLVGALSGTAVATTIGKGVIDIDAAQVGSRANPDWGWGNYPIGVWQGFRARTGRADGFEMVVGSDLPMASGLSSSAAIEVVTAIALDHARQIVVEPALDHLDAIEIGLVRIFRCGDHEHRRSLARIAHQIPAHRHAFGVADPDIIGTLHIARSEAPAAEEAHDHAPEAHQRHPDLERDVALHEDHVLITPARSTTMTVTTTVKKVVTDYPYAALGATDLAVERVRTASEIGRAHV